MAASRKARSALSFLLLAALAALGAAASEELPNIAEADLRSVESLGLARAADLAAQAAEPTWLVYRVASLPHHDSFCCRHGNCRDIEHHDGLGVEHRADLETEPILILLRFEGGTARRARVVGDGCSIGFSGRQALWAGDVPTDQSLAFLRPLLDSQEADLSDELLVGIAHHRGDAATNMLFELARESRSDDLATDAVFWLGTARGMEGFRSLERLLNPRPDSEMLEAIVFALSQSPAPAAAELLVSLAREDPEPDVRREALFWLGQSSDEFAEIIYQAALSEKDTDVARHAVFVLSQISEPENIEYLTQLLEQRRRPHLRREALFWIGQSGAPNALDIVSRVLNQ